MAPQQAIKAKRADHGAIEAGSMSSKPILSETADISINDVSYQSSKRPAMARSHERNSRRSVKREERTS